MITLAIMAVWGAVVWRMRGGAFAAVTGIDIGTQSTRLACGVLLAIPTECIAGDWRLMGLAVTIFAGLAVVGWAPFMAFGADGNAHVGGSPFERLPAALGIPKASAWTDAVAWFEIGTVCMAPSAALLWWCGLAWWWLLVPALAFAGVYWAADAAGARRWLPYWRVIDTPEAWAEFVMGAVIGAALAAGVGVA